MVCLKEELLKINTKTMYKDLKDLPVIKTHSKQQDDILNSKILSAKDCELLDNVLGNYEKD